jgi:hypothetical protein
MVALSVEQEKIVKQMEDELGPEYVVFEPEESVRCKFMSWPTKGQFATESGVIVPSYYFPVDVDGEEMILSASSKRLQRLLLPLLKTGDLIGHTYDILAMGEGVKRKWALKRVS